MASNRIHYIDVCKGILIIIVVIHHVFGLMMNFNIVSYDMAYLEKIYVPFFMPAFFIITGYCSNFDRSFKEFFYTNTRQLLIPGVCFFVMIRFIEDCMLACDYSLSAFLNIIILLLLRGGCWFLVAMFVSKVVYWCLSNFANRFVLWGG